MKKITFASFLFIGILVTGLGAVIIGEGDVEVSEQEKAKTTVSKSTQAGSSTSQAKDALDELINATTDSAKCKAFAKVKIACAMTLSYDDDSSSDHDSDSTDDVSDYKKEADKIWAIAKGMITIDLCKKEVKCAEMKHKFFYDIHGDDDYKNLAMHQNCGDDKSKDHKSEDHKSNEKKNH